MPEVVIQRHMPRRRSGHTTSVTIGGERFYLTANGHADGSLGEVFMIDWLPYPDRASLDVFTIAERMAAARTWMDTEDRRMSRPRGDAGMDAFHWEIATGISVPVIS